MPNNCLSVLYKHIIQVENKNVGLKVGGGTNIPLPPPPPLPTPVIYIYIYIYIQWSRKVPKSGGMGGGAHRHVIYVG